MATILIDPARVRDLADRPDRGSGDYVLYWMQQSQRAETNHALEHAIQEANDLGRPLVVGFGLTAGYPEASLRHYRFMLEGLVETADSLDRRGIRFVLRVGDPDEVALELARDACLVVCDRGYLRHQKAWRARVAEEAGCRVTQVEADVVVPVDTASHKAEYAARTLRPKIHRLWDDHLVELRTTPLDEPSAGLDLDGEDLRGWGDEEIGGLLDRLDLDRSVPAVPLFQGGTRRARTILRRFLDDRFAGYDGNRNQPQTDAVSHMAKYLHFGQISPVWLALEVRDGGGSRDDRSSYLEELVVRRELAMNFVHFRPDDYDDWAALPGWARQTLDDHRRDRRDPAYTRAELADAATHDPYWNAAMREMRHTGYMHNYMRMYWGKKILEWTESPEAAHATALALNNRYFLDGRDPNSFANVGWLFGLHDRPWGERPIFGKVRYMSAGGLERKADPGAYVDKVDRLVEEATGSIGSGG